MEAGTDLHYLVAVLDLPPLDPRCASVSGLVLSLDLVSTSLLVGGVKYTVLLSTAHDNSVIVLHN